MRFVNPHMGQPAMMPQQQMVPVQQQFPQQYPQGQMVNMGQPQQQFQTAIVMTPAGPQQVMVPVGQPQQVAHVQMPQQFPQQYPQQNNNQAVLGNTRFSGGDTQQFQSQQDNGRYHTPSTGRQEQQTDEPVVIPKQTSFVVKPMTHKIPGCEKLKLTTYTTGFADTNFEYEESYVASDSLASVAEYVLERANDADVAQSYKMLKGQTLMITHTFYSVDLKERLLRWISVGAKALYKLVKSEILPSLTTRYELVVVNKLDDLLTQAVNDFLAVNAKAEIEIDSFFEDFNDLLRVIRTSQEDLEDALTDVLDDRLGSLHVAIESADTKPNTTIIPELVLVTVLDKHSMETGLEEAQPYFMKVEDTASNIFLRTMAGTVMTKTGKSGFLMMTTDKKMFYFMRSVDNDLFVRAIV